MASTLRWPGEGQVIYLNDCVINESVDGGTVKIWFLLGEMLAPTAAGNGIFSVHLVFNLINSTTTVLDVTLVNRGANLWTRFGPKIPMGIEMLQQPNGSYAIWLSIDASAPVVFWGAGWTVLLSREMTIQNPAQQYLTAPTGTVLFSTLDEVTYPPVFASP